eukprot:COSAG04_NODE_6699_length_1274_cov_1.689362_2_plen_49_part_00
MASTEPAPADVPRNAAEAAAAAPQSPSVTVAGALPPAATEFMLSLWLL